MFYTDSIENTKGTKMVINTKDIKKHQTGPILDNIFYTIDSGNRYSDAVKKFTKMGILTELKNNDLVVEIPLEKRETIKIQNLLESPECKKCKLPIVMGVDVFGNTVVKDLQNIPHLLVTGRTGSGKTVFLKNIYESLTHHLPATDCKFLIIDTKKYDFNNFNDKKNLFMPVVSDVDKAIRALDFVTEIIDERYIVLKKQKSINMVEYNKKFSGMPYLIVMIDELADLMCVNKRMTEAFIQYIAQKGLTVGVHLVVATQKTEKEFLSDLIMANIPNIISFQTRDKKQSLRILGDSGAELLLPYGDMLYSELGQPLLRIHVGI